MSKFLHTVEEIDSLLVTRMADLAQHLAPQGALRGHEWIAINPARGDRRPGSFSINVRTGAWKDFASGDGCKSADGALPGLSLVSYLATKGDFKEAIVWAKRWLGIERGDASAPAPDPEAAARARAEMERRRVEEDKARDRKLGAAFEIFLHARAIEDGDPAASYLSSRGITRARLSGAKWPRSLRYHHGITHPHVAGKHAALIACLSLEGYKNGFAGIHRIYLERARDKWVKAFGASGIDPKVVLGYQGGASVRISAGASGKKLSDAPAGEWIHVTEGIEDGLSLSIAMPDARVIACFSLASIGQLKLPPHIGGVTIVADNDPADSKAAEQLQRSAELLAERHAVKIARMPAEFKDVNDALLGKRKTMDGAA